MHLVILSSEDKNSDEKSFRGSTRAQQPYIKRVTHLLKFGTDSQRFSELVKIKEKLGYSLGVYHMSSLDFVLCSEKGQTECLFAELHKIPFENVTRVPDRCSVPRHSELRGCRTSSYLHREPRTCLFFPFFLCGLRDSPTPAWAAAGVHRCAWPTHFSTVCSLS